MYRHFLTKVYKNRVHPLYHPTSTDLLPPPPQSLPPPPFQYRPLIAQSLMLIVFVASCILTILYKNKNKNKNIYLSSTVT